MPSLNLRNAIKRDPSRLTLKQRAAALRATASRVFRRASAAEAPPVSMRADPRLVAMAEEIFEARRKLNDPSVPDGPEADALGDRETVLSIEIHQFPSRSIHDLRAKLPFLREEAEDAARGWESRVGAPFEASVPGAAWAGLLRDIEHLASAASAPAKAPAAVAPAAAKPDPIMAAIDASKRAQRAMTDWNKRTDAIDHLSADDFAEEARLNRSQFEAHDAVISTVPTTAMGRLALLEYLRWQMGLYSAADGRPEADSPFWPDAYRALKAALAFEGGAKRGAPLHPATASARDLSKEAYDYAHGLDLAAVPFSNLWRMYEAFAAARDLLQPVTDEEMFNEKPDDPALWYTPGGYILDAEVNRLACLRDAMAGELERRKPDHAGERDARLEVLISHEIRCEGRIRNAALLAEINAAWGA